MLTTLLFILSQIFSSLNNGPSMYNSHTDVLLAGAFAASTVDLLVYPLDTLKTRYQSPDYVKIYYDASKNAIDRRTLFRGLYQGVGSVVLITIPSSGAFFTTYEAMKSLLSKANPTHSGSTKPLVPQPFIHSAASATAELVSCFILTPAEVLKQNAQMIRRPAHSGSSKTSPVFQRSVTLQAFRQFKKPSQLFRGYTALAARNLPFTAMQFPMYEHLREQLMSYRRKKADHTVGFTEAALITAVSAGIAGSIAAVVTTPIDVVKTRIMLSATASNPELEAKPQVEISQNQRQSNDKLGIGKHGTRKSGLTIAREVMQESGFKGLFRGGILRAVWTALGSGIYLGAYETGKVWLGDRRDKIDETY